MISPALKVQMPGTMQVRAIRHFASLTIHRKKKDGSVDISKAIKICQDFEISREFWAHLVEKKYVGDPSTFIRQVPHMSFVWGQDNVNYLKNRFDKMHESALFRDMQYTENRDQIADWAPLVMKDRNGNTPVAATNMHMGTDVNFGELTRQLIAKLESMPGVTVHYNVSVLDIDPHAEGGWIVETKNLLNDIEEDCRANFVFLGAGGATLHLLKDAEIEERKGYGGFPVSGLWLKCNNPELINQHNAKVYGKASVGSPPMSVPHVDTRMIDGKKELLFGPFAGFSMRFLKTGSHLDLAKSFRFDNLFPMISAGMSNVPLTRYLIEQVRLKHPDRVKSLQEYVPTARLEDWELQRAGQRVQVIKKEEGLKGKLEFGTEAVVAADGSVAALLGASPGASTAAAIMFNILPKCFPEQAKSNAWQNKLKEMAPSLGVDLNKNEALLYASRERTARVLRLRH